MGEASLVSGTVNKRSNSDMTLPADITVCAFDLNRHWRFAVERYFELLAENLPDDHTKEAAKIYRAHVENVLADRCARIFMLERGGKPVGMIEANFRSYLGRVRGHIVHVYLVPELRGTGIATQLMKIAEEWLKQNGAESADLNVTASNTRAVKFYRKMGYEVERLNMKKRL